MFASQKASAVSIGIGCLLVLGCGGPSTSSTSGTSTTSSGTSAPPPPPSASNASGDQPSNSGTSSGDGESFSMVVDDWESGAKDDAVGKLLQIDWDSPAAIGDIPIMGLTEKEFATLSSGERREQQAVAMKLARDSKAIVRHAFSLAEAEGAGDNARAKQYYEAARRLGNALAGPERLSVMQMMGTALVKMADEKLAAHE